MAVILRDNTPEVATKTRTITINKSRVYEDIDSLTYKFADASTIPTPRAENAYQSDANENLDGRLLARQVEFRDAKLRQILQFAIPSTTAIASATNELQTGGTFVYTLELPEQFRDNILQSIAVYIHRYLVWGALYDWYGAGLGSNQAAVYANELQLLEAEIINSMRSRSSVRRPMQPFGPRRMPR